MVATFGRRERIARRKERFRACVRARACGGKRRGTDDPKLDFSFQVQEGRRRSLADWRCSRASVQRELIVDSGRTRSFREASALSSMVCVCVCARVPRFRLRPHQDTTRTGRVYGPAHCIWSQKCHTDAPHALPPRSRTPPAIEISGGRVEKERGWRRSLSLFRVCASDDNLPRLFETRTR